jgi:hypothetical protein
VPVEAAARLNICISGMRNCSCYGSTCTMTFALCVAVIGGAATVHASRDQSVMYNDPSLIVGGGRGVYAGRNYSHGEVVIDANVIVIPSNISLGKQLDNYIFETGFDGMDMLALNYASLLNHGMEPNVEHYWNDIDLLNNGLGLSSVATDRLNAKLTVQFVAARNIRAGEEILTSYGDEDWFTARFGENSSFAASTVTSVDHSSSDCLDDVYIDNSDIPLAGKGLFSQKTFSAGDIITTEPAVTISIPGLGEEGEESGLIRNYCLWDSQSDVGFVPLGNIWAVNHAPQMFSNARLDWHKRLNTDFRESSGMTAQELLSTSYTFAEVALVACKEITPGDEIVIDYGDEWALAWTTHLADRIQWMESHSLCSAQYNVSRDETPEPRFRHPIGLARLTTIFGTVVA